MAYVELEGIAYAGMRDARSAALNKRFGLGSTELLVGSDISNNIHTALTVSGGGDVVHHAVQNVFSAYKVLLGLQGQVMWLSEQYLRTMLGGAIGFDESVSIALEEGMLHEAASSPDRLSKIRYFLPRI